MASVRCGSRIGARWNDRCWQMVSTSESASRIIGWWRNVSCPQRRFVATTRWICCRNFTTALRRCVRWRRVHETERALRHRSATATMADCTSRPGTASRCAIIAICWGLAVSFDRVEMASGRWTLLIEGLGVCATPEFERLPRRRRPARRVFLPVDSISRDLPSGITSC